MPGSLAYANNVHQLMNMASTITGMIVHLLEMLSADMVVAARQHAKELLKPAANRRGYYQQSARCRPVRAQVPVREAVH